jgi:hypothetical protein
MIERSRLLPRRSTDRAGALSVGATRFQTVSQCAASIVGSITACLVTETLVLLFIGTVRSEPPEAHSGKLPASHMDLANQLGL